MTAFLAVLLLASAFAHPESGSTPIRTQDTCTSLCASSCTLTPEQTEGPYYYTALRVRSNITEGLPGVRLRLRVKVVDTATCAVIPNAAVDIWHCNANGDYSHFVTGRATDSDTTTYLRGVVMTDETGHADIDTIYPGWYVGRATHIHVKVHLKGSTTTSIPQYVGGSVVHTGQIFFNDSISDDVGLLAPYNLHLVTRTRLTEDNIYTDSGGSSAMGTINFVTPSLGYAGGLRGEITMGVDQSASSTTGSSSGTCVVFSGSALSRAAALVVLAVGTLLL